MSKSYTELVKEIFLLFAGNVYVVAAAGVVMLLLLLLPGNKKVKQFFLWPAAALLVFINNPLTIHFIVQKGLMAYNRYVRLYWLLPVGFVLAYLCVCLMSQAERWRRYVVAAVCVCVIAATGSYMFTKENYTAMTNFYKIPDDVIEICTFIRDDVARSGKELRDVRIVVPTVYSSYIHQYDGEIKTLYGRHNDSPVYYTVAANMQALMDAPELDAKAIAAGAEESECDYIVVESVKPKTGTFKRNGYEKLIETEDYGIYKKMEKEREE